jgi:predicted exporter
LLFAKVHILALVFGSSLIGGVIDYSIHFFADRFRSPADWTTRAAYEHVGGAIALGLATTLLGYVVLLLMPFPGLRQIATFCIAGLAAGCGAVLYGYPMLYRAPARLSTFGPRTGAWLTQRFSAWRWSSAALATVAILAVFAAFGIARIETRDDVTALQASPRALLDEEKRVATLLHSALESRYFLVSGADAQHVIETEERLTARLDELVSAGKLGAYTAVTRTLPSLARQRENAALLERDVLGRDGLQARAWAQLGFDGDAIARRVDASMQAAAPLTPDEWLASPASEPYRLLWLHADASAYASIVTLGGINDVDALRAIARDVDGVRLIDRIATISAVLHRYRVAIGWLLAVVYFVAGAVLSRRFGWREVPSLLAPSAAASLATLGAFGWLGVPVNLFTLLSLWLVLGLGIDYGIFLRHGRTALSTAVLSVTLSAITTLLAFGLLAFSATPFIRSIGATLLVSITLSWLFAMLACVPGARDESALNEHSIAGSPT